MFAEGFQHTHTLQATSPKLVCVCVCLCASEWVRAKEGVCVCVYMRVCILGGCEGERLCACATCACTCAPVCFQGSEGTRVCVCVQTHANTHVRVCVCFGEVNPLIPQDRSVSGICRTYSMLVAQVLGSLLVLGWVASLQGLQAPLYTTQENFNLDSVSLKARPCHKAQTKIYSNVVFLLPCVALSSCVWVGCICLYSAFTVGCFSHFVFLHFGHLFALR